MTSNAPGNTAAPKCVTVANADDAASSSYVFRVEEEGKLPLLAIMDTFGMTRIELTDEPGMLLSWDVHGNSNVPFKFGETVSIRGVPADRPVTAKQLDQMLDRVLMPCAKPIDTRM